MKVQDVMTKNPVTISPDNIVDEAWDCINRFHIWTLPVVDKGKIVGVITKSDLKHRSRNGKQKISKIMTMHPLAISIDKDVNIAADIMQKARINALLVTENEKFVGIITIYDIYKKSLLVSSDEQKLNQIKEKIREWKNEGYNVVDLEKMIELKEEKEENRINIRKESKKITPKSEDFEKGLKDILLDAQQQGKNFVDIKSGDLHRVVGGYPGYNHRMPICCNVMKKNMRYLDQILDEPPKGFGASLVIRYKLPR